MNDSSSPPTRAQQDSAALARLRAAGRLSDDGLRAVLAAQRSRPGPPAVIDVLLELRLISRDEHASLAATAGSSPRGPAASAGAPDTIGRYVIEGELGRGGMGVVLRARDPQLGREVAIKMIIERPGAGAVQRQRFEREARAVARLRHPAIVAVHEVGEAQGRPYLVMDLIRGRSLEAILEDGARLPARRAAEVARTVALALAHAHEQGVVHRDVKPGNILVDDAGGVLLTDFGLAREVESGVDLTVTGQLVGTPDSMAPEQARGVEVGPPADVYALGGLLYRALSGRRPHEADGLIQLLQKLMNEDARPFREVGVAVHPDLETIALRCLERDPARRPPSASFVAAELERFLAGEPIASRPPDRRERALRWLRQHRALAAVLLVLAATLLGSATLGVAGVVVSMQRIRWERDAADAARRDAEAQSVRAGEAERAATVAARLEALARAGAEEDSRAKDGLIAEVLLEKARRLAAEGRVQRACALASRSQELAPSPTTLGLLATWLPDASRRRWASDPPMVSAGAVTPSSLRFAVGDTRGRVRFGEGELPDRLSGAGAMADPTSAHAGAVLCLDLTPDGSRATSGGADGEVRFWRPDRPEAGVGRAHTGPVLGVAWSPDGERVASAGVDGALRVWDAAAATAGVSSVTGAALTCVAWSRDGASIVTGDALGQVHVWSPDARVRWSGPVHRGAVLQVDWADGDRQLVTLGEDRALRVWSAAGPGPPALELARACIGFAVEPSGDAVHTVADGWVDRDWRLPTGAPLDEVSAEAHARGYRAVRALPAWREYELDHADFRQPSSRAAHAGVVLPGERVLVGGTDGRLRLIRAQDGGVERVLDGGHDDLGVAELAASRDGSRVASAGRDGTVRTWSVAGGEARVVHRAAGNEADGTVMGRPPLLALDVAADGRLAVAEGERVRLFDPEGRQVRVLEAAGPSHGQPRVLTSVRFDPSGERIAAGGVPDEVLVWSAASGELVARLRSEVRPLTSIGHTGLRGDRGPRFTTSEVVCAFLPDGSLAVAHEEPAVRVWSIPGGALLRTLRGPAHFSSLACSPDGAWLAGGSAGAVWVWRTSDWSLAHVLDGLGGMVVDLSFSPDGRALLSLDSIGAACAWDLTRPPGPHDVPHAGADLFELSPDGRRAALFLVEEMRVRVHDLDDGRLVWEPPAGPALDTRTFELLAGGRRAVIEGELWSVDEARCVARCDRAPAWPLVAASRDGARVALDGGEEGLVVLWTPATGATRSFERPGRGEHAQHIVFSPDGGALCIALPGAVLVIDATTGLLRRRWEFDPGDFVRTVAWGEDGRVVACRGQSLELLDLSSGAAETTSGQERRVLATSLGWVTGPGLSPQLHPGDDLELMDLAARPLVAFAAPRPVTAWEMTRDLRLVHLTQDRLEVRDLHAALRPGALRGVTEATRFVCRGIEAVPLLGRPERSLLREPR